MPDRAWSSSDKIEQSRRQPSQRQEIEPVVFEHGNKRPGIARTDEPEVPSRNFGSRHVCRPARPEHLVLQGLKRARSLAGAAIAPEPAGRMEYIQVRQVPARPRQPVIQMSRLDQRRVERFPVEGDERAGPGELGVDHLQKGTFVGVPQQHELTRDEPAVDRRTRRIPREMRRCRRRRSSRSSPDRRRQRANGPAHRPSRAALPPTRRRGAPRWPPTDRGRVWFQDCGAVRRRSRRARRGGTIRRRERSKRPVHPAEPDPTPASSDDGVAGSHFRRIVDPA